MRDLRIPPPAPAERAAPTGRRAAEEFLPEVIKFLRPARVSVPDTM
ncbi:hypothetical protein FRUB_08475 [Fimbriiglobus ruber]|uniref:Uncharacterized protein n=1 Tax=Fimbriiglobus ruber TaxID=1908690 RepID=A0A225D328_9BACT|nr:hypothetical protein FRUB_08475 [Fimbriiglobus ruber]